MPDGADGFAHRAQAHRIVEQMVQRVIQREGLGHQRRHAVVEQEFHIALLLSRNRVDQNHRHALGNRFGHCQSAGLCDDAVCRAHEQLDIVHKPHDPQRAVAAVFLFKCLQAVIGALVVAADGKDLAVQSQLGDLAHQLAAVAIAHAAAHDQHRAPFRVQLQLRTGVLFGNIPVEFRMNRNSQRQNALLRDAALDCGMRNQLACRDQRFHVDDILPVRVDAVVGHDADARCIHHVPVFHFADQMRRKHMCAYNCIRLEVVDKMLELKRAERVDNLHNIHFVQFFPVLGRLRIKQPV